MKLRLDLIYLANVKRTTAMIHSIKKGHANKTENSQGAWHVGSPPIIQHYIMWREKLKKKLKKGTEEWENQTRRENKACKKKEKEN